MIPVGKTCMDPSIHLFISSLQKFLFSLWHLRDTRLGSRDPEKKDTVLKDSRSKGETNNWTSPVHFCNSHGLESPSMPRGHGQCTGHGAQGGALRDASRAWHLNFDGGTRVSQETNHRKTTWEGTFQVKGTARVKGERPDKFVILDKLQVWHGWRRWEWSKRQDREDAWAALRNRNLSRGQGRGRRILSKRVRFRKTTLLIVRRMNLKPGRNEYPEPPYILLF